MLRPKALRTGDLVAVVAEPRTWVPAQRRPITDRLFEIEFLDPGAAVYAFTFG